MLSVIKIKKSRYLSTKVSIVILKDKTINLSSNIITMFIFLIIIVDLLISIHISKLIDTRDISFICLTMQYQLQHNANTMQHNLYVDLSKNGKLNLNA